MPSNKTEMPAERNLYAALGGHAAVVALIDAFYRRVLADPLLAPYFKGVPLERLRRMQYAFFSAALGGPEDYKGRVIAHAHQGMHISREHFQHFVDHLFETLSRLPLSEQDRYDIIARINLYADDVIGVGSDFGD